MVFPAGTFSQPTTVTVRSATPGTEFGAQSDNQCYAIDIAGSCFAQPITVSYPNYGGADRDIPLALAQSETDADAQTMPYPATIVMGSVRNGALSLTIPRADCDGAALARRLPREKLSSVVYPVTGVFPRTSQHFRANVPQEVLNASPGFDQLVLTYAEHARDLLIQYGYSFDAGLEYPLNINVEHGLPAETWGLTSIPLGGKASQSIILNADHCIPSELTAMQATTGHEFFHVVQHLYNPLDAYTINHPSLYGATFFWLAEASSVWFEAAMIDNPNHVSPVFVENISNSPRGLENYERYDGKDAQNMGYWASGYIRWLAGHKGLLAVRQIWEKVKAQTIPYADLTAVIAADDSPQVMAQRWTSFMHAFLSRNTGYAGWNFPNSSDLSHFTSAGTAHLFTKDLFPFSGQRWLYGANNGEQSLSCTVTALDDQPGISYALYTSPAVTGPFTYLTTLHLARPQSVTLSQGKALLVTAVNANTDAPYHSPTIGKVAVNPGGQSAYCPGVPANAVRHDDHDGKVYFFHPTLGFEIALEVYADWGSSPDYKIIEYVVCSDAATGAGIFQADYYTTGTLRVYTPFDADKKANGVATSYYENSTFQTTYTFAHGILNGPFKEWYANGNVSLTGEYANDARVNTWKWYNEDGSLRMTCIYIGGESQCFYP